MSLLIPLGLLGLISIAVLLLIYIIKPNYQQKFISSTYIWKLSLKYKKKNLPISKLRNILMIICQILILILCAFLLAKPVIGGAAEPVSGESVAIIDASASMRVENGGEVTRFERAVEGVRKLAEETVQKNGFLTVILAGKEADVLAARTSAANMSSVYEILDGMLSRGAGDCSFGSADMEGAFALAEDVLVSNPEADVVLYTATDYRNVTGARIVSVAEEGEWNAAVLDCKATYVENYYNIEVDVGCYGRSENVTVTCMVFNPNGAGERKVMTMSKSEFFAYGQEEITFTFGTDDQLGAMDSVGRLYSFDYIQVYIDSDDSFDSDNRFFLYGGTKETINIQYSTTDTDNPFFRVALYTLRSQMRDRWNISYREVNPAEAKTEGYDFYIFEHTMPKVMPQDGVVFLVNPSDAPAGSGLELGNTVAVRGEDGLTAGETHAITRAVNPANISMSRYRRIINSDGYLPLMYCGVEPVLLVKDMPDAKYVVFAGDVHYSNVTILIEFPMLIKNMYEHFLPFTFREQTVDENGDTEYNYTYSFHVDDVVNLRSRGEVLHFTGEDAVTHESFLQEEYTEFPLSKELKAPGVYTFTQSSLRVEDIEEKIYVSVASAESNITKQVYDLPRLVRADKDDFDYKDLVVIFAAIVVGLLFAEWFLQSREYFK